MVTSRSAEKKVSENAPATTATVAAPEEAGARSPSPTQAIPFVLMAAAGTLVWILVIGEFARRVFQPRPLDAPSATQPLPLREQSSDVTGAIRTATVAQARELRG